MLYTLDTNFVSKLLSGNQTALANLRGASNDGHEIVLNAICYYEIKRGLALPRFKRKLTAFDTLVQKYGLLDLDTLALDEAISIYQDLRQRGTLIEDADLLTGAIAKANDATLVTHNVKHLNRITELSLTDWEI